jgi:hypothetical protein
MLCFVCGVMCVVQFFVWYDVLYILFDFRGLMSLVLHDLLYGL